MLCYSSDTEGLKKKKKRKKKKECRVVVNTTHCKYDVVRSCAADMGWEWDDDPENAECGNFNFFWTDTSVSMERVARLKGYQRLNHFPSMHLICRKVSISTSPCPKTAMTGQACAAGVARAHAAVPPPSLRLRAPGHTAPDGGWRVAEDRGPLCSCSRGPPGDPLPLRGSCRGRGQGHGMSSCPPPSAWSIPLASLPGTRTFGYPRIPSISPISPSGCRILSFVKGTNAKVCGLRKNGDREWDWGTWVSRRTSLPFFSHWPRGFRHFLPLVEVVHAISIVIL